MTLPLPLARTLLFIALLSVPHILRCQAAETPLRDPTNHRVPMRDGVALSTSMRLPAQGGPAFPVIFVRTPYGKAYDAEQRAHYTRHGYAVVVQDCRGTGESVGDFEPYLHEKEDGYDALDWISRQAWCDGHVGMIGASYSAQVQWLAAAGGHPVLKALIPQVSGTDPFFDVPYDHGILKLSMIEWAYKLTYPERETPVYVWDSLYTLPVSRIDEAFFGVDVPLWNRWTQMDRPEDWAKARFLEDLRNVDIPVLHVSGNWDVEALSTQMNWQRMQAYGHAHQHFLFGPWEHTGFLEDVPTTFSGIAYGEGSRLDFEAIWLRWFDHWLKGTANGVSQEKPVQLFVTGLNTWVALNEWPDTRFARRTWHFNLSRPADGTHALSSAPAPPDTASYTYVPDSVRLNMDPEFAESALFQLDPHARDRIALLSPPFPQRTVLGGPAYADLVFAVDRPDVDLFVLLAEMDTAGQLRALTHPGKVRASFRDGRSVAPLPSGEFVTARIDLFPFAHAFSAGSRLAVIVRSSWFPRYIRNLGTSDPIESATRTQAVNVRLSSAGQLVLYEIPEREP